MRGLVDARAYKREAVNTGLETLDDVVGMRAVGGEVRVIEELIEFGLAVLCYQQSILMEDTVGGGVLLVEELGVVTPLSESLVLVNVIARSRKERALFSGSDDVVSEMGLRVAGVFNVNKVGWRVRKKCV